MEAYNSHTTAFRGRIVYSPGTSTISCSHQTAATRRISPQTWPLLLRLLLPFLSVIPAGDLLYRLFRLNHLTWPAPERNQTAKNPSTAGSVASKTPLRRPSMQYRDPRLFQLQP